MSAYLQIDASEEVTRECLNVISALSKARQYGFNFMVNDTDTTTMKILESVTDFNESIKELIKYLPRPSIDLMANEVRKWYKNSPERHQVEFQAAKYTELLMYNGSLGGMIRHRFSLWAFYKQDDPETHPDAVSLRVIEKVWGEVQDD